MWTYCGRNETGVKHFRGLSTDPDITDAEALEMADAPLRNGDEAYYMDAPADGKKVKLYDEQNQVWIKQ